MKIKVVLASLAVVAIAAVAFSFTSVKRSQVTISFKDNTCDQKIPSSSGNEDCRENSLSSANTFVASNWVTTGNSASLGSGNYLARLVYDNTDYSTMSAVLSDVQAYFNTNGGSLPADGQDIVTGTKHITVRRAIAVY